MFDRAIITACSTKYFPWLINLLGSIKANYPKHPKIFVYNLGLLRTFRKELEKIDNVEVLKMPHFCNFWRSCFTWKTYIFAHPIARLNFYLDAGCQVLGPLDEIFEIINKDDYFIKDEGGSLRDITPKEYKDLFGFDDSYDALNIVAAGIFGFKNTPYINTILERLYNWALIGLCLGFSSKEQWKNKGKNKNVFIRNCKMFRHDLTLLNIILRKSIKDLKIHDFKKYGSDLSPHEHPHQLIWHFHLNNCQLEYLKSNYLHNKTLFIANFNRLIIHQMLFAKRLSLFLKKKVFRIIK